MGSNSGNHHHHRHPHATSSKTQVFRRSPTTLLRPHTGHLAMPGTIKSPSQRRARRVTEQPEYIWYREELYLAPFSGMLSDGKRSRDKFNKERTLHQCLDHV